MMTAFNAAFDPDDFCRACGQHRGEGRIDCWRCEGEGGNLQVEGLSMRGEQAYRDRQRMEAMTAEAQEWHGNNMGESWFYREGRKAAIERGPMPKSAPAPPTPQEAAFVSATLEWASGGRVGAIPKWEDFANKEADQCR